MRGKYRSEKAHKFPRRKRFFESVSSFVHTRNLSVAKKCSKKLGRCVRQKKEENRRNPDTPPPFSAANGILSKHTLHPSKMGEEGECIRQRSSTQILKRCSVVRDGGNRKSIF